MDSLGMLLGQTQELSLAGQSGSPIMDHSLSQSSADEAFKGGLCCHVAFLLKGMLLPHSIPELHRRGAGSSSANGQRHQIPDGHQSSGWYRESCSHTAVLAPQAPPRAGVTETLGLLLLSLARWSDVLPPVSPRAGDAPGAVGVSLSMVFLTQPSLPFSAAAVSEASTRRDSHFTAVDLAMGCSVLSGQESSPILNPICSRKNRQQQSSLSG